MGNMASSLNTRALELLASAAKEARSDPSAILDPLNTQGRNLASALLDAIKTVRSDPSAVLNTLNAYGRNIIALLLDAIKEVGSIPLVANLLSSFRRYWYKVLALAPISQTEAFTLVAAWWIPFVVTTVFLYLFIGFGRAGVRGGSPASNFQSRAYGGYTPKGGFFASSTSAGMRGTTPLIYKAAAVLIASFTVVAVYRSWVRK